MRFLVLRVCLLFTLWMIPFSASAETSHVSRIEIDDNDKSSSLTIYLSQIGVYKTFQLTDPDRLLIDLSSADWQVRTNDLVNNSKLVKELRYGTLSNDSLRIALDLAGPITVTDTFFIQSKVEAKPHQLVLVFTKEVAKPKMDEKTIEDIIGDETVPKKAAATPPTPKKATKDTLSKIISEPSKTVPRNALAVPVPISKPAIATGKPLPASMRKGYSTTFGNSVRDFSFKGYNNKKSPPRSKTIAPARPVKLYKPIIVIDPGHGGMDPGAIGSSGIREKELTLRYSRALANALLKTGRYRVVLTRSNDKYVPLGDRVKKAQRARGDIFISIHADAHANRKTRGFSVYTISEHRAKREAKKLERVAHKKEVIRDVDMSDHNKDVRSVLIDMAQRETKNTAKTFAEILVKHMGKVAKLLRNTHRHKSLRVLTGADIPSALIELGYLSNRYEEKLLKTRSHQNKIVRSIVNAVDEYFSSRTEI